MSIQIKTQHRTRRPGCIRRLFRVTRDSAVSRLRLIRIAHAPSQMQTAIYVPRKVAISSFRINPNTGTPGGPNWDPKRRSIGRNGLVRRNSDDPRWEAEILVKIVVMVVQMKKVNTKRVI